MVPFGKDHIVFANEATTQRLADAIAHAHAEGGELQKSLETSLEHIDNLGKNNGRVRISSEDFNFFNLWIQRRNSEGEWETMLTGGLVGFGLKCEDGRIRIRDSGNPSWSIHS